MLVGTVRWYYSWWTRHKAMFWTLYVLHNIDIWCSFYRWLWYTLWQECYCIEYYSYMFYQRYGNVLTVGKWHKHVTIEWCLAVAGFAFQALHSFDYDLTSCFRSLCPLWLRMYLINEHILPEVENCKLVPNDLSYDVQRFF